MTRTTIQERREARQAHREALKDAIRQAPVTFAPREQIVAVPTLGGILSDLPLEQIQRQHPGAALLPVSERLHELHEQAEGTEPVRWVVVNYQGRGVAMTPIEAEALGLDEAPDWLPEAINQA